MNLWQIILLSIYCVALGSLLVFSFHRFAMVHLYLKNRGNVPVEPVVADIDLPPVTVQLPVYNELYVLERLIEAVCALDYPPHLLEIQVLDDSTDETTAVAQRCVAEARGLGIDAALLHRTDRCGFKAGALEEGMKVAKGDLVAVFDADFVPNSDFLRRTVPHLVDNPGVGMVQMRWAHLNRDYSLITKVQSVFLDGHFVIEHGARSRSGLFFNFNGTAGIWRRECIEEAGGWEHDTLTEDLDLSYRAQMNGWRFVYLNDHSVPAEVPVTVTGWKAQQFRWVKGSVQTARKLLPRLLASDLRRGVKAEAILHLCANMSYLMLALLAVLIFPAALARKDLGWLRVVLVDLPLFVSATAVLSRFYIYSQREIYADWKSRLRYIPLCLAMGMGISFNNGCAVFEALIGHKSPFNRTPKFGVVSRADQWLGKRYTSTNSIMSFAEVAAGLYFMAVIVYSVSMNVYFPLPFLLLFCVGFLYVGTISFLEGMVDRRRKAIKHA
ncbi:MAG TPA: glycosyl transferase family 2 [Candidatus Latescibacteria bacterium]|nr:glycosyl transferase family 2 [Candidatus Latescibacterota bacterium]